MIPLVIALLFGGIVAWTGPAFQESRQRRREIKDRPAARVYKIPPSCWTDGARGKCPIPGRCAVCRSRNPWA